MAVVLLCLPCVQLQYVYRQECHECRAVACTGWDACHLRWHVEGAFDHTNSTTPTHHCNAIALKIIIGAIARNATVSILLALITLYSQGSLIFNDINFRGYWMTAWSEVSDLRRSYFYPAVSNANSTFVVIV